MIQLHCIYIMLQMAWAAICSHPDVLEIVGHSWTNSSETLEKWMDEKGRVCSPGKSQENLNSPVELHSWRSWQLESLRKWVVKGRESTPGAMGCPLSGTPGLLSPHDKPWELPLKSASVVLSKLVLVAFQSTLSQLVDSFARNFSNKFLASAKNLICPWTDSNKSTSVLVWGIGITYCITWTREGDIWSREELQRGPRAAWSNKQ